MSKQQMIKCIVWDLDGTLWQGTLAEGDHVALREAAVCVVREADAHGVLQSVASRNQREAAFCQLKAFTLADFFLYPQMDPYLIKPDALREIAAQLNISTDSIAFVDDDPFEIYEVRRFLPEVYTYGADETDILLEHIRALPEVSSERRAWMRRREARREAEHAFAGSRADFLRECNMVLTVREAREADLPRVRELASRTRKINNTAGSGFTFEALSSTLRLFVCELEDIFGPHGVVGAGLFRLQASVLHMDLFCVSCRVEGRGVAAAFLNAVLRRLAVDYPEVDTLHCRLNDVREGMAAALLKSMGFSVTGREGNAAQMVLALPYREAQVPWIKMVLC